MSNRELPMMPWYPDQFAASTEAWSFAEAGLYRTLLDAQWKLGVLPAENARLARIAKMGPTEFKAAWKVVRAKFARTRNGGLINKRLEFHRLNALGRKEKLSQGGRKGGQASSQARLKQGLKPTARQAQGRPTASGNPLLHSSHIHTLKSENSPPSLGLEAPPGPDRERATPHPRTTDTEPGHGAQNGTAEKAEPPKPLAHPLPKPETLAQKARALSSAGQSVGDIVKTLQQYSVTPAQVEAWLGEAP